MAENQRLVEFFQYDPASPGGPYRIFPVGKFVRGGKEFAITDDKCAEFAKNFTANVLGRDVVTNIEHLAEEGAVGWIKTVLHKAGDGLYAVVDWTERGLKLLAEQSFRYFSPEVIWENYEATDGTKHNNVLTGLAVTNYPYFGAQTAMFSEKAAPGAEAWMNDDADAIDQFMYDMPMSGGDGHNLLGMLESVSFIIKCLEKADEPNTDMIDKVTAVKDALKEAVNYIVAEFADAEPEPDTFATKTEDGVEYDKSCYLVADSDNPSEWKLRIKEMTDGKKMVTKAQLGRAAAALGKGFRGNKVQLSAEQRKGATAKLKAEYKKMGVMDADMPKFNEPRGWLARLLSSVEPEENEIIVEDTMADKQQDTKLTPTPAPVPPAPVPTPAPTPAPQVTVEQFTAMESKFNKMLGDLQTALEAKAGEVERFKEQFTTEQTARRKQTFADTAREQFSALSGTADELGARLMWAFDSDTTEKKDHYTWFTGQLTAANAAVAEKMREIGHTQPRTDGNDAFSVRLTQKQAALKAANPKLTDAEAFSEALEQAAQEDPQGGKRWFEKNG